MIKSSDLFNKDLTPGMLREYINSLVEQYGKIPEDIFPDIFIKPHKNITFDVIISGGKTEYEEEVYTVTQDEIYILAYVPNDPFYIEKVYVRLSNNLYEVYAKRPLYALAGARMKAEYFCSLRCSKPTSDGCIRVERLNVGGQEAFIEGMGGVKEVFFHEATQEEPSTWAEVTFTDNRLSRRFYTIASVVFYD